MTANKCDVCEALYESYGIRKDVKNCNSILLLNTDGKEQFYTNKRIDLCPICQKALYEFLGLELVKPKGETKT